MKIACPLVVSSIIFLYACQSDLPTEDAPATIPILTEVLPIDDTPQALPTETPITFPTDVPTPTIAPNAITLGTATQLTPVFVTEDIHRGAVYGVAISSDGSLVASASADSRVRLFEVPSGSLLYTMERHEDAANVVAFSPDGLVLVSGGADRTLQFWDPASGERITGVRTPSEPAQIEFFPGENRFAYAGFFSGVGEVRTVPDGTSLYLLEGHNTRLRSVAVDPTGIWVATGDRDGKTVLHGAHSGNTAFVLSSTGGEILSLAFSRDGDILAVGGSSGIIELWDVARQQIVTSWVAHSNGARSMVYTIDNKVLITAGTDGAIRLWNVSTGERLASYTQHGNTVNSISLSEDGTLLVSGGNDARVILWEVSSAP